MKRKTKLVLQTETIKDLQLAVAFGGDYKSTLVSYTCPPPTEVFSQCINRCPVKQ
jgi:hypothetical protein